MIDANAVASWMVQEVGAHGCLYQDDVVDHLVKMKAEHLARENADGNLAVGKEVLNAFKKLTETTVVWVKPDLYWRLRVAEDEPGREARG